MGYGIGELVGVVGEGVGFEGPEPPAWPAGLGSLPTSFWPAFLIVGADGFARVGLPTSLALSGDFSDTKGVFFAGVGPKVATMVTLVDC